MNLLELFLLIFNDLTEKFELECDMIKQQYSRLECSIQNIFEGSTNQLEEKIASYDDTLSNKTAVISEVMIYCKFVRKHELKTK